MFKAYPDSEYLGISRGSFHKAPYTFSVLPLFHSASAFLSVHHASSSGRSFPGKNVGRRARPAPRSNLSISFSDCITLLSCTTRVHSFAKLNPSAVRDARDAEPEHRPGVRDRKTREAESQRIPAQYDHGDCDGIYGRGSGRTFSADSDVFGFDSTGFADQGDGVRGAVPHTILYLCCYTSIDVRWKLQASEAMSSGRVFRDVCTLRTCW